MANNLPTVTSQIPRDLQQFVQRVREALDGGGPEALVTARQLIAAGVVTSTTSGNLTASVATSSSIDSPSAPSNLTASGALSSIIVSWEGPFYRGHAYTEIWAHSVNSIGDAQIVGMTPGNNFAHQLGGSATRYYWVRNVNQNGDVSAFNATAGVSATTGTDAAYLLSLLAGEITSSELASSLSTKINLIDAADTVSGSVNERISNSASTLTESVSSLSSVVAQLTGTSAYVASTTYAANDLVTYNNNLYKAKQSTTGNLPTNTTFWDLVGNYSSISQVVVANTAAISTTNGNVSNNAAAILSEVSARTNSDSAFTQQLGAATSQIQNNSASVVSEQTTRANADSATAAQIEIATSRVQDNAASVIAEQTTRADADTAVASQLNGAISEVQSNSAAISSEIVTRATADSATAAQIVGVESTVNNNTAAIATEISTRADADSATAALNAGLSAVAGANTAALATESTVRADADASTAAQTTLVTSTVNDVRAAILTEASTRATNDSANASQVTTLQTTVGGNTTSIQTNATSINGLEAQYTVKIDNNGHVAGFGLASEQVNGIVSSDFMVSADRFSVVDPSVAAWVTVTKIDTVYSNSVAYRSIQGPQSFVASFTAGDKLKLFGHPDGHNGEFTVYSQFNLAGEYFVLVEFNYAKPLDTVTTVEATASNLRATKAGSAPFVISTGSTVINGTTVPAGTYINSAMIAEATITSAQIGSLTADRITSGLLNTVDFYGNTIAGATIYIGGAVTYAQDGSGNNIGIQSVTNPKIAMTSTGAAFDVNAFTIDNGGNLTTPFVVANNQVVIDTAAIGDGTITNAKIGSVIQSTNYSAGSAGWNINKNGSAEFNDGTFRGTLAVGPSSGSRLTISSTKIEVYEGNTLRVRIGNLS